MVSHGMSHLFPYANIVAGVFILIIGFCFHWLGQFISLFNWDLATRLGLQEKKMLPEYKVYEHAIAVADATFGWLYGVAAVGLFLNAEWGYKLAFIPGSLLLYHAISAWVWEGNRRTAGRGLWSDSLRIGWCTANALAGVLALLVAWAGRTG
ncbi:hypothetical protein ACFL6N_02940 [Thermodesulfobacteriota bacterium]